MKKVIVLALLGLLLAVKPLFADDDYSAVDLERIVVTPARTYKDISEVPQAVSVITSEEIEESNAQSLVDILRYEPGILVRDYYSSGVKATVDLRGFGETAPSNVLVLIDGRRVNEIDISGADWTQIPLSQIERIEIARGGASVLYGDNAVGGVINIITKSGKGKPKVRIAVDGGSYHMRKNDLDINGSQNDFSYSLRLTDFSTAGYRLNSYYHSWDLGAKLGYEVNPNLKLVFSSGYHDADFGLPGSLSEANLNSTYSRRDSKFTEDRVGETDGYADLEIKNIFNEENVLSTAVSFRERRVDNLLISSLFVDGRKNDTFSIRPKYTLTKELWGHKNNLVAGFDFYAINTVIDEYGALGVAKTRDTDIDRLSRAFYFQDDFNITKEVLFNFGFRSERADTSFDSTPLPGDLSGVSVDDVVKVKEDAYKLGLNYNYQEGSKIFANFSRNFRLPATDEYFSVWSNPPVNTNLLPQASLDNEWGIQHRFNKKLKMDLSFFRLDLRHELYYDPSTFTNNNYLDKTRHQGIEYGFEAEASDWLSFYGNYTYTDARFRTGTYDDKTIPAVASNKVNAGMRLRINRYLEWYFNSQYTGKSYLISDQANRTNQLDSYTVFNAKLTLKNNDLSVFAGVNNLFNEKYSEYAVTNAAGTAKNFYPAAERNFVFGAKKEF